MIWYQRHPAFRAEMLGFIPSFLDERDPRDAKTQLDAGYGYGRRWGSARMELGPNDELLYPGDLPEPPLAECRLRDERIILYRFSFVAVIEPDGSFAVQRMD